MNEVVDTLASPVEAPQDATQNDVIGLVDFITDFGAGLLQQVRSQNPPIYDGLQDPARNAALATLKRRPFEAQRDAVHALAALLLDRDSPAAVLNAEMGTGKTMMAICLAALTMASTANLVMSPLMMSIFCKLLTNRFRSCVQYLGDA